MTKTVARPLWRCIGTSPLALEAGEQNADARLSAEEEAMMREKTTPGAGMWSFSEVRCLLATLDAERARADAAESYTANVLQMHSDQGAGQTAEVQLLRDEIAELEAQNAALVEAAAASAVRRDEAIRERDALRAKLRSP